MPALSHLDDDAADPVVRWPALAGSPGGAHLFERRERLAIHAALAAGRPLLVRGEPGTGKSQLARAAAHARGWAFVHHTVDALTEPRDLLWTVDSVARLAEAQVAGVARAGGEEAVKVAREQVAIEGFVQPGALWWAFDWAKASELPRRGACVAMGDAEQAARGVVLLIDELDKADESVPNGLLDALASQRFPGPAGEEVVARTQPLVVITTNEERALPAAFLRRCLVLQLHVPDDDDALRAYLLQRARVHFEHVDQAVLDRAAGLLSEDRAEAKQLGLSAPGLAEYLDLIRAVTTLHPSDAAAQEGLLKEVAEFALRKHPELSQPGGARDDVDE